MCRLLGIVASEPTEFRIVLADAPRSLANLSREHPDGWGLATFAGVDSSDAWSINKGIRCAKEDADFHRLAVASQGALLVAHVRQRTVGCSSLHNTHPFQRGRWVFAHNGTIKDIEHLRARTSEERLGELQGETDSELFFAYLLTKLDECNVTDAPVSFATDRALEAAVSEMRAREDFGSCNFLLAEGGTLYAHRSGRSLFLLERGPHDRVRVARGGREGVTVETPWSQRRSAVFVASERLTDEPWDEIPDRTLLRIDRRPLPSWRLLGAEAA